MFLNKILKVFLKRFQEVVWGLGRGGWRAVAPGGGRLERGLLPRQPALVWEPQGDKSCPFTPRVSPGLLYFTCCCSLTGRDYFILCVPTRSW